MGAEVPMPIPHAVTRLNKKFLNQVLVHLAGHGWFVELEHVGRRSGRTFRIPIMAFDRGDVVTVALTYGSGVDWLANLRAAGGGRMHLRDELLVLGAPAVLARGRGPRPDAPAATAVAAAPRVPRLRGDPGAVPRALQWLVSPHAPCADLSASPGSWDTRRASARQSPSPAMVLSNVDTVARCACRRGTAGRTCRRAVRR